MRFLLTFAIAGLLLPAIWWPAPVHAQVRRCTGPQGGTVYTDRRCADIGGVDQLPRTATGGVRAPYRGGCARNLQDLVYEISAAIDSGDANRLASVYHWTGMSSRQGYAVLDRLSAVVKRPMVEITAIMPATADGIDGDLYPQTSVRRAPIGLRVEQTLANGSTPSRTVFGLTRYFDCWWIRG